MMHDSYRIWCEKPDSPLDADVETEISSLSIPASVQPGTSSLSFLPCTRHQAVKPSNDPEPTPLPSRSQYHAEH